MLKVSVAIYSTLMFFSFATSSLSCSADGKNTSISSSSNKEVSSLLNSELSDFKFEDFNSVLDTKKIQEKLSRAFPEGSSIASFSETMEALGAKKRAGEDGVPPSNQVYYEHISTLDIGVNSPGSDLIKKIWIVGAKYDESQKIQEVTVKFSDLAP
jgi:hypothetical protein